MVSVRGQRFLTDPQIHSNRVLAQLQAEAAAQTGAPPRYRWGPGYWCAVKPGTWPNVTGWAESREAQSIFQAKLTELTATGFRKEARTRAEKYAKAQMLARATSRKQASDEYYAHLDVPTPPETQVGAESAAPPPG